MIDMSIYPNPSKGVFYLDAGDITVDLVQVVGYAGAIMQEIIPEPGSSLIEVDLSTQPAGPYFIKIFNNQTPFVKRIIIVR